MSATALLLLALGAPWGGAVVIALLGARPYAREAGALAAASVLLFAVALLFPHVAAGDRPGVALVEILPGLAIAFEAEPLGTLFALVASSLWLVTTVYSIGYMRGKRAPAQTRFYACFALALGSATGVAFAANMITLFAFYELLTLTTYPLVTHWGGESARRAGRTYLGVLLGTSIGFQLFAVLWTWHAAGTLDFRQGGVLAGKLDGTESALLLALYVFGVGKAALMPFHRWLPAAMVAPVPVSALLHAVAVVKAGVFTVLKVALYLFGLDLLGNVGSSRWLMYAGAVTVLLGAVAALREDDLKRRLAYSTVSQLGYIVVGAMTVNAWGVIGGGLHLAAHAFGKITLFFCAGSIDLVARKTKVSELGGLGRTMPLTMAAFAAASLSVIGLPPWGGLWSKWYLVMGVLDAGELAVVAILLLSSLISIAYLLPIPLRAFFPSTARGEARAHSARPTGGPRLAEAPTTCVAATLLTAAGCLVLFLYPEPLLRLLRLVAAP